jgi:hypothetical protein
MTDRTWTGAASNDASDPGNWSPAGVPQPGDSLTLGGFGRVVDITDDALAGDTLNVMAGLTQSPNTFNLSDHAVANLDLGTSYGSVTVVNVSGRDTLSENQGVSNSVTVNLEANADLFGNFNSTRYSSLKISGAENATFHNNGSDNLDGTTATIDAKVAGTGTFNISFGPDASTGSVEFGGFVSRNQTVELTGGANPPYPIRTSKLTVDDPGQFHATVILHDYSLADLVNLADADSWSYRNDMLSIRNSSGQVIDRVHIVSDSPSTGGVNGLSVSKTAAGDVLVSPGTDFKGALSLTNS